MTAPSSSRPSSSTTRISAPNKNSKPSPSWTLDEHVSHLTSLLKAYPAAEELQSTWDGYSTTSATKGSDSLALGLKNYKAALDSGRRIGGNDSNKVVQQAAGPSSTPTPSGLPLWTVVRILKASWHADGSWPLVGADASEEETFLSILPASNPAQQNGTVAEATPPTMRIPRSVHPAGLLVKRKAPLVTTMAMEPGPPARPDPTPDQVAQAYRSRGIAVPDPPAYVPSDDEDGAVADPAGPAANDNDSA
ncbi:hypothetical protein CF327_g4094 [Tilletia walkeri]|nr:hypothetical protein CF327_g4094 [Tilletia walkeri]